MPEHDPEIRRDISPIHFAVTDHFPDEDRDRIMQGLVEHNESHAPGSRFREIAVLARHERELIGGLTGHTHWNWLFVNWLWVAKDFRQGGIGRKLMAAAHAEARTRGCQHVHLDTFDFQALPFYESLGYTVFGKLEDFPAGHTRFFLQKRDLDREG
jgi:GNAT superfamily N-acetyltransferase